MRKGSKQTEEAKRRISESMKGQKHTEETKKKMSASHKKYWEENKESRMGYFQSEENREKKSKDMLTLWQDEDYQETQSTAHTGLIQSKETISKRVEKLNLLWAEPKFRQMMRDRGFHREGEQHHNWQGGKSYEDYPKEFSEMRPEILERDSHICQYCGVTEEEFYRGLDVHHIDHDKHHNDKENLVVLCSSCNIKANYNKDYWHEFYLWKVIEKNELVLV